MTSRLGQWSPARREICLSRQLVENHPWDEIREVLRHETAHQLADAVLAADSSRRTVPPFSRPA